MITCTALLLRTVCYHMLFKGVLTGSRNVVRLVMAQSFCGHPQAFGLKLEHCHSPTDPKEKKSSSYCGMPHVLSQWYHTVFYGLFRPQGERYSSSFGNAAWRKDVCPLHICRSIVGRLWGLFLESSASLWFFLHQCLC